LCGTAAGVFSKTVVYPLDTIRKRFQVQGPNRTKFILSDVPLYERGILQTAYTIIQHEGIHALYKGLTPGLLKAGPSSAVAFVVYGQMKAILSKH